jgi:hypothetical protein
MESLLVQMASLQKYKYKHGGTLTTSHLHGLFVSIWQQGEVPQELKDALIVHLFKNKGDRRNCDNHRGISLLLIAGKILANVVINRLTHCIIENITPESQCGFRPSRGTADMLSEVLHQPRPGTQPTNPIIYHLY